VVRMVSFRAGHPATRAAVQGIRHDVFTSITPDCHLCGVAQSNQHLSRPQTNERTNERTQRPLSCCWPGPPSSRSPSPPSLASSSAPPEHTRALFLLVCESCLLSASSAQTNDQSINQSIILSLID
jgi:hypothetical protein